MVLCDTDVMIEFLKGNAATKNLLENNIRPENIALSSVSIMELYFGAKNKKELILIKKFLANFEILKINEGITNLAVSLVEIYSKSHGLKVPDALIGATSIYNKMPLFTYNKKDFSFINELNLYSQ
jgi:predicted nucleic acid-binding protein